MVNSESSIVNNLCAFALSEGFTQSGVKSRVAKNTYNLIPTTYYLSPKYRAAVYLRCMKLQILLIALLLSAVLHAQSADEKQIRTTLDRQTAAWNSGNLEAFMDGYWRSDSLMFIGKSGVTYGWQNTLNNYKKGYPDTAAMGKLHFDIIQVKRLSVIYFSVVGKWHLARSIGDLSGHFTLLFRKINNKWVIVSDHSS